MTYFIPLSEGETSSGFLAIVLDYKWGTRCLLWSTWMLETAETAWMSTMSYTMSCPRYILDIDLDVRRPPAAARRGWWVLGGWGELPLKNEFLIQNKRYQSEKQGNSARQNLKLLFQKVKIQRRQRGPSPALPWSRQNQTTCNPTRETEEKMSFVEWMQGDQKLPSTLHCNARFSGTYLRVVSWQISFCRHHQWTHLWSPRQLWGDSYLWRTWRCTCWFGWCDCRSSQTDLGLQSMRGEFRCELCFQRNESRRVQ